MKLHKRKDFVKLPANTIYSRLDNSMGELCHGLFCKTSGKEMHDDWVEQDLISEIGIPNGINYGCAALVYQLDLRDRFLQFKTDLDCSGRDGTFDDSDVFVVWDKEDIRKLYDYLGNCLKEKN